MKSKIKAIWHRIKCAFGFHDIRLVYKDTSAPAQIVWFGNIPYRRVHFKYCIYCSPVIHLLYENESEKPYKYSYDWFTVIMLIISVGLVISAFVGLIVHYW